MQSNHSYTLYFGQPFAVQRIHPVSGEGHSDHIRVCCHGGVSFDLSIAGATELTRRLPEAIGSTSCLPDCSGSCAEVGEP